MTSAASSRLKASIIVPTYNEAEYIEDVLNGLLSSPEPIIEVIVADGRSEDDTRAIVQRVATRDKRVKLIDNPQRLQSPGLNLAAAAASAEADILIRLDAHSAYPVDFIPRLIDEMERTGAQSVVVRLRTVGGSCFEKAVAIASNSFFGTGGSRHRMGKVSGYVDHGHHAAIAKTIFERIGGYDETFAAAEDAEFDKRVRDVGGKIWFAADIVVDYFPRSTPSRLAAQYYRNGIGRAQAVKKHRGDIRLRQVAPPVAFLAIALSFLAAPLYPLSLVAPALYLAAVVGVSLLYTLQERDFCMMTAVVALPAIHFSWAAGFLRSFFFGPPARRRPMDT